MAVDINNGFINQRPDGVENEFEANKKMQSNPGGLPIGDYMISQPDSNLHNVYLQQAYPENTVWNTDYNNEWRNKYHQNRKFVIQGTNTT